MKSILAMQMAIEISCGFESPLVPEDEEIKPQKVIYFDGELKDSDIKERYGKTDSAFLNNIDRITDCWEFSPDQLLNVVETYVLKVSGDCTVIFDNYYSLFKNATEKQVVNIREKLKSIQKKALGRVTFIIVVHTTKNGDKKSLDVNDIYGSSYFRNLASIIIGINQTDCNKNHKSLTILKTTGNRSLHEGQVLHERLVDNVYLHFTLDSINGEPTSNSLSEDGDDHDEQTDSNSVPNPTGFSHEMKVHIWTLNKKHSMSYDKIVEAYMKKGVKISRSSVGNYVKEIEAEMNSQQPSDI